MARMKKSETKQDQDCLAISSEDIDMQWKVHLPNLLKEIAKGSGQSIYRIPLSLLGNLLAKVGERAAQLNDPILNDLMCKLTIYEIANPEAPWHDPSKVKAIADEAKKARAKLNKDGK